MYKHHFKTFFCKRKFAIIRVGVKYSHLKNSLSLPISLNHEAFALEKTADQLTGSSPIAGTSADFSNSSRADLTEFSPWLT